MSYTCSKKCLIDQTGLGVRCHPEGEFRPLLFSHFAGPLRGQCQPLYQVTAADLLKYGKKCPEYRKMLRK